LARPNRFVILVYRMPTGPTANRVAVWRQLKKIGGIYLQQSVTAFPQVPAVMRDLQPLLRKIDESGGEYHLLPLRTLSELEESKLVSQFVEQSARHYQEIIENCEVNFAKEIEFETFRRNFTYEEAEEIRAEFEKIVSWYERVRERDWFGAANQAAAIEWLKRSQRSLEQFEATVFAQEGIEPMPTGARPRGATPGPTAARPASGTGRPKRRLSRGIVAPLAKDARADPD
jgi:hypothetical protein